MGANIDCTKTCEQVCSGLIDCPCNDNGRGVACWVPHAQAHELCGEIRDCHVISKYAGELSGALPHYNGWSHLGGRALVPVRGFVASICDRSFEEERAGCYSCNVNCNSTQPQCDQCFQNSHSIAFEHPDTKYCDAYDGFKDSVCSQCKCCQFLPQGRCVFEENRCMTPLPVCAQPTLDTLRGLHCDQWISESLLGAEPSIAKRCECLLNVRERLGFGRFTIQGTNDSTRFDCGLTSSATHSVTEWLDECLVIEPCSNGDHCSGCRTYQPATESSWIPVVSVNSPKSTVCSWSEDIMACVVKTDDGVLHLDTICSTRNATSFLPVPQPIPVDDAEPLSFPDSDSPSPSPSSSPSSRRLFDEDVDARGHTLTHAVTRKDPVVTNVPAPSPSSIPLPKYTDLEHTTIGHALEHRHFVDARNVTVNFVIPCHSIPDTGFVTEWHLYAARAGVVHAQILRETEIPAEVDSGKMTARAFEIVGENILRVPSLGKHTFKIEPSQRIHLKKGDVIGFYGERQGVVSWSPGGTNVLYRYGSPIIPSPAMFGERQTQFVAPEHVLLFAGNGTDRTYSIALTGKFGDEYDEEAGSAQRKSQPQGSDPQSTESSQTGLEAPQFENMCKLGESYWCLSVDRMLECSIPEEIWKRMCSVLPSPSPACDPFPRCPDGYVIRTFENGELPACFVASRDCEPDACGSKSGACNDVWKFFNQNTFGNASCPYCDSGRDWTGLCALGTKQSPIKIEWEDVDTDPSAMQFFHTHYHLINSTVTNNGYALEVKAPFGWMDYEGQEFFAEAIMIHAPAEHQVQGTPRGAVEFQIVHRERYSRGTVIIAVIFDEALFSNSAEAAKILEHALPKTKNEELAILDFNLNTIVDSSKPMVWYNGSLTVPPCSESVVWGVQMGANLRLSKAQVHNINSLFKENALFANGHGNNRQLQLMNGRRISLKHNCGSPGAIACPAGSSGEDQ